MATNRKAINPESMPTVMDDSNKKFGQGDYGSEDDIEGGSMLEKGVTKSADNFGI